MVRPRSVPPSLRPLVSLFNSPPTSFVTPSSLSLSPSSKEEDADAALSADGKEEDDDDDDGGDGELVHVRPERNYAAKRAMRRLLLLGKLEVEMKVRVRREQG